MKKLALWAMGAAALAAAPLHAQPEWATSDPVLRGI